MEFETQCNVPYFSIQIAFFLFPFPTIKFFIWTCLITFFIWLQSIILHCSLDDNWLMQLMFFFLCPHYKLIGYDIQFFIDHLCIFLEQWKTKQSMLVSFPIIWKKLCTPPYRLIFPKSFTHSGKNLCFKNNIFKGMLSEKNQAKWK